MEKSVKPVSWSRDLCSDDVTTGNDDVVEWWCCLLLA